jgi:hypothetical protein
MTPQEESDQLPEEQPSGAVHDDDGDGGARDDAQGNAGAADDDGDKGEGQATGNPGNAG